MPQTLLGRVWSWSIPYANYADVAERGAEGTWRGGAFSIPAGPAGGDYQSGSLHHRECDAEWRSNTSGWCNSLGAKIE